MSNHDTLPPTFAPGRLSHPEWQTVPQRQRFLGNCLFTECIEVAIPHKDVTMIFGVPVMGFPSHLLLLLYTILPC